MLYKIFKEKINLLHFPYLQQLICPKPQKYKASNPISHLKTSAIKKFDDAYKQLIVTKDSIELNQDFNDIDDIDEFSCMSDHTQRIKPTSKITTQRSVFSKEDVRQICAKNSSLLN